MPGLACFSARSELDQSSKALDRFAPLVNGLTVEGDPCVTYNGALDGADADDQVRIGSGPREKAVRKQAPLETIRAQARSQARDPSTQGDDPTLLLVGPLSPAGRPHQRGQTPQGESAFQHRQQDRQADHFEGDVDT
jgi:hypothetical protein